MESNSLKDFLNYQEDKDIYYYKQMRIDYVLGKFYYELKDWSVEIADRMSLQGIHKALFNEE